MLNSATILRSVTKSYFKDTALVVLPPMGSGRLQESSLRKRLARARLRRDPVQGELLRRISTVIDARYPAEGLAALRMWGQTGDRPTVWLAAADPVYLEPRLDHLCVHALRRTGIPSSDIRELFNYLQQRLAEGSDFGFARLGTFGYLRADKGLATATAPTYVVHGDRPDKFLPAGEGADDYRRLVSEIEMALHEHDVNLERLQNGLQPVNSLWIWGGGCAPERRAQELPTLFADDPLVTGFWESASARSFHWPSDLEACLEDSARGFVAMTPDLVDDIDFLEHCLAVLYRALSRGKLGRVVLLSRDGIRADIGRRDSLRFWRRDTSPLDAAS
jgi:hypothetical protein